MPQVLKPKSQARRLMWAFGKPKFSSQIIQIYQLIIQYVVFSDYFYGFSPFLSDQF